jgi:enoyl-[acyl-carrier protein] reductase I
MVAEFKGKSEWAIILGASSGLGLATAHKLAQHGMNLILCYRARKIVLAEIQKEFKTIKQANNIELLYFNMDVTRPEKRDQIIAEINTSFGAKDRIKTLIHSIAKGNLKPMIDSDMTTLQNDDFHLTIESMGVSLYDWTKQIFENQLFSDDARVLSFTSEGDTKAWKNYAAVSAAKVVLESITRSIALEFAPHGIRANCIQAGVTDTASLRMIPGSEQLIKESIRRNPYGRLTRPEEIANVVYLLTKAESSWINGTIIPVNGGEHLR